jgi:hypothetical protein
LYIALGLFGVFVLWQVLKVLLGSFLPLETTGRAYLVQRLKKMGIRHLVPNACLEECFVASFDHAKLVTKFSKSRHVRDELIGQLDLFASMLGTWVHGTEDFARPEFKEFKGLFEKHGVHRQRVPVSSPNTSFERTREG